jgi:hypothetical protein
MPRTVPYLFLVFTAIQLGSVLAKTHSADRGADAPAGITTVILNGLHVELAAVSRLPGIRQPFGSPRPNANIHRSVAEARVAFLDNLFLNVWPSKPDGINGSERIVNVPELTRTLKTCAALRRQFLRYFMEGSLVGNCLLTAPSRGVRLSADVLPDRVPAIVLNQCAEGELAFDYDVSGWLNSANLTCIRFDESGRETLVQDVAASGTLRTGQFKPLEMTVFEFRQNGIIAS